MFEKKKQYRVIGVMSGTSLDGLDIVHCNFYQEEKWKFELKKASTIPFPENLYKKLSHATNLEAISLANLDLKLGDWIGQEIKQFQKQHQLNPHFISYSGHTVFHQPESGLTYQIGSPDVIYHKTKTLVISNFRIVDVLKGGQGAPLVPIGDRLLFPNYSFCLNLGGIANISYQKGDHIIAYDIMACNMVLNYLAQKMGYPYDKDGGIAANGKINSMLLEQLSQLDYYDSSPPKSLGYEWVSSKVFPLLTDNSIPDQLHTYSCHLADQIQKEMFNILHDLPNQKPKLLITGGGALNKFLVNKLKDKLEPTVAVKIPPYDIVCYKEALIFAFLGVLRMLGETNILGNVTGASEDSCAGTLYGLNK